MKAVILAGGLGTRISEETYLKPKPLIEIGGMPIIWHIMKIYSQYGINEFVVCCGYKGNMVKDYFNEFNSESWDIKTIDTGLNTMTGGRIKRIQKFVEIDTFCLSYGDDLKKVNITQLIDFHKKTKRLATVTITKPQPRFGIIEVEGDKVIDIKEKSKIDEKWINGGYFVLEPGIFDYINGDDTVWENEPLKKLASIGQLSAFKYEDEYYPLDTLYDKNELEKLWKTGKAYWKTW
ncbi:MAG: glucose-1-phosphate cytidylyltransferase [Patescibacteria group bacterium]|nr:glucose-1-phosphate cytidylyltransferase [Patescibacteria group bacterium]